MGHCHDDDYETTPTWEAVKACLITYGIMTLFGIFLTVLGALDNKGIVAAYNDYIFEKMARRSRCMYAAWIAILGVLYLALIGVATTIAMTVLFIAAVVILLMECIGKVWGWCCRKSVANEQIVAADDEIVVIVT